MNAWMAAGERPAPTVTSRGLAAVRLYRRAQQAQEIVQGRIHAINDRDEVACGFDGMVYRARDDTFRPGNAGTCATCSELVAAEDENAP
jgi:hypothetical protein